MTLSFGEQKVDKTRSSAEVWESSSYLAFVNHGCSISPNWIISHRLYRWDKISINARVKANLSFLPIAKICYEYLKINQLTLVRLYLEPKGKVCITLKIFHNRLVLFSRPLTMLGSNDQSRVLPGNTIEIRKFISTTSSILLAKSELLILLALFLLSC